MMIRRCFNILLDCVSDVNKIVYYRRGMSDVHGSNPNCPGDSVGSSRAAIVRSGKGLKRPMAYMEVEASDDSSEDSCGECGKPQERVPNLERYLGSFQGFRSAERRLALYGATARAVRASLPAKPGASRAKKGR